MSAPGWLKMIAMTAEEAEINYLHRVYDLRAASKNWEAYDSSVNADRFRAAELAAQEAAAAVVIARTR